MSKPQQIAFYVTFNQLQVLKAIERGLDPNYSAHSKWKWRDTVSPLVLKGLVVRNVAAASWSLTPFGVVIVRELCREGTTAPARLPAAATA